MHAQIYKDPLNPTDGYVNAIEKHHEKIDCIGHPDNRRLSTNLDMKKLVDCCNAYNIPLEFNCCNLVNQKTVIELTKIMLSNANQIYINSDAHTLHELTTARKKGIDRLIYNGYLDKKSTLQ